MEFIDFICAEWRTIVGIILSATCILVTLLRNKVKIIDSAKEFILEHLPVLIKTAEDMFDSGSKKKEFVVSKMMDLLYEAFPSVKVTTYQAFISKSIERILSTPEKKEAKNA